MICAEMTGQTVQCGGAVVSVLQEHRAQVAEVLSLPGEPLGRGCTCTGTNPGLPMVSTPAAAQARHGGHLQLGQAGQPGQQGICVPSSPEVPKSHGRLCQQSPECCQVSTQDPTCTSAPGNSCDLCEWPSSAVQGMQAGTVPRCSRSREGTGKTQVPAADKGASQQRCHGSVHPAASGAKAKIHTGPCLS